MSASIDGRPGKRQEMHKRIVDKDDGRKLYSYTFGDEPDPFEPADSHLVAEVQPAPTAMAEADRDV